MTWRPRWPGLPLLARELTEQAARRRTFVIRTVYAVILYGIAGFALYERMSAASFSVDELLGSGDQFVRTFTHFQLAGVYLILPAITCGVMTSEKERDTLGLLLLTKLGPWTILWEKLLSRLFPMLMFLLLPVPLYAIAYSLGGVDIPELVFFAWLPLATAFQVGCFSLLCSVWFRTTAGAFIASYVGGLLVVVVGSWAMGTTVIPLARFGLFGLYFGAWGRDLDAVLSVWGNGPYLAFQPLSASWYLLLLDQWSLIQSGMGGIKPIGALSTSPLALCAGASTVVLLGSGGGCLGLARMALWRRAFLQPGNPLLAFFRGLDQFFHRINQNRWTRGIQLVKDHSTLPLIEPVAWMETTKRSLATLRYRVRILLVMMIPLLPFIATMVFDDGRGAYQNRPYGLCFPIWMVVVLLLGVQASGLIAGERSRQTLDVLLSTPMTAGAILEQKLAGVWRLAGTMAIPFATAVLWETWHSAIRGSGSTNPYDWASHTSTIERPAFVSAEYLLCSAAFFFVYTRLLGWLGIAYSLVSSSRIRAILWTLGTVLAICSAGPAAAAVLDLIVGSLLDSTHFEPLLASEILRWTSPAVALLVHERLLWVYRGIPASVPIAIHLIGVWLVVVLLRRRCYRRFGPATHRVEPAEVQVGRVRIATAVR